jgi:hypothetical protein
LFSCDPGWYGDRCDLCKPTDECKKPFYDAKAKRCKCSTIYNIRNRLPDTPLGDDLKSLDQKQIVDTTGSTYLTLSVLTIVLLCICALLLLVVIVLTIRNSGTFSMPCFGSNGMWKKTQSTNPV